MSRRCSHCSFRYTIVRIASLAALLACAPPAPSVAMPGSAQGTPAGQAPAPKLVVLITVDQMRYDYLERFAGQYRHGLARLNKGGASFTAAFQDHANTETAPGHATTLSGREPYRTGIVLNALGVPDRNAPLVGGGGPGASPFRFRGTALFDWMKARDARSRALSVSRKDRGAILPIGRAKESVFWYANDGRFTTSTYYSDTLPAWVNAFNAQKRAQAYAGKAWEPLLPLSAYPEPDTVAIEDFGREPAFPHVVPSDPALAARDLIAFPFMDDLTVAFALAGVNAMKLGAGPAPDLLAVSLSTTDAVGHRFGMASREMHDQMLRLDRAIGVLIDSLYTLRDSSSIVIALTADHGVTLPPELARPVAGKPRPVRVDLAGLDSEFRRSVEARGAPESAFDFEDAMLLIDRPALEHAHLNPDSIARAFTAAAKQVPGVYRADLFSAILKMDTLNDPITRRWRHAIPPDYPVAAVVTLNEGSVWGTYATGIHGSPWDDDDHVPLVFYGPQIAPGRRTEFSRVVDLAPTLAEILGVRPSEPIDGHVLRVRQ